MGKERKRIAKVRLSRAGLAIFLLVLAAVGITMLIRHTVLSAGKEKVRPSAVTAAETAAVTTEVPATEEQTEDQTEPAVVFPVKNSSSAVISNDFDLKSGILVDVEEHSIVASKAETMKIYPASMTKIMTLIVAVENIDDFSDTVTITYDMVADMYDMDAVVSGLLPDETPTIEAVLYGMVLNSGGDAAIAAARYVSGTEEAFVELMNQKAAELGLTSTHFTNPVGLHDPEHYSTAEDIAVILEYALKNEKCKEILSAYIYEVPPTEQHPEGLTFTSTLFSRMYGDEIEGVEVLGGKTGFTDEAGNCLATYAKINEKIYIFILCGAETHWNAVYDTLSVYSVYCAGGEPYDPPA